MIAEAEYHLEKAVQIRYEKQKEKVCPTQHTYKQCFYDKETSQLICQANKLTGLVVMEHC